MIQANCNPSLTSISSASNCAQLQQLNAANLKFLSEKNQRYDQFNYNQSQMYNYSHNYLPPPTPYSYSQFCSDKNFPQPTYIQPVFYPSYSIYPYTNSLSYNNYTNYYQIQQNQSQAQFSNTNNSCEMNSNSKSLGDEQLPLSNNNNSNNNQYYHYSPPQQTAIINDLKTYNKNNFYDYCSSITHNNQQNISYEDDSFGSIFQPSSLIHPTQFKKFEQYMLSNTNKRQKEINSDKKQNNQQVMEFEPVQNDNKYSYQINSKLSLNENVNISNIQINSQTQKVEKLLNESNDSQKVFKPKTFKEIEEEEKQASNYTKRNTNQSFKRGTKNW